MSYQITVYSFFFCKPNKGQEQMHKTSLTHRSKYLHPALLLHWQWFQRRTQIQTTWLMWFKTVKELTLEIQDLIITFMLCFSLIDLKNIYSVWSPTAQGYTEKKTRLESSGLMLSLLWDSGTRAVAQCSPEGKMCWCPRDWKWLAGKSSNWVGKRAKIGIWASHTVVISCVCVLCVLCVCSGNNLCESGNVQWTVTAIGEQSIGYQSNTSPQCEQHSEVCTVCVWVWVCVYVTEQNKTKQKTGIYIRWRKLMRSGQPAYWHVADKPHCEWSLWQPAAPSKAR